MLACNLFATTSWWSSITYQDQQLSCPPQLQMMWMVWNEDDVNKQLMVQWLLPLTMASNEIKGLNPKPRCCFLSISSWVCLQFISFYFLIFVLKELHLNGPSPIFLGHLAIPNRSTPLAPSPLCKSLSNTEGGPKGCFLLKGGHPILSRRGK